MNRKPGSKRPQPGRGTQLPRPELPDSAARLRIRTELDRSLLVEAGAGSGKTHELAARMAAGIARGVYDVEHMAAVTFTRKAAAELRGRFQLALEEEQVTAAIDARDRIQHALANIERFFAGTIHAFCARLLRERPVEAGVAPGFSELDDADDKLLRAQSWRDFRSQAVADGDPGFLLLEDAGVNAKQLDDAFRTVCLHEEVDFPAGDVAMPDDTAAWIALEAFWATLSGHLERAIDPETTCQTQKCMDRFRRDWDFFARNGRLGSGRSPAVLASLLGVWDFAPKIVQKWWSEDPAEKKRFAALIPAQHEAFRTAVVVPFQTAWREYVYGIAVRVLVKGRTRAALARRRLNVLNYSDLLGRTAAVLRESRDVREAMQQKYRWLFVDEFQDTDPLQAEIIFLLAGLADPTEGRDGGADWQTTPIRPGALFVVGDPKQSIYRFTRADINIYNQVRARLAGADGSGSGVVTLTSNFRSTPALCEWANQVFEPMFPPEATDQSPRYAPLVPVRASGAEAGQGGDPNAVAEAGPGGDANAIAGAGPRAGPTHGTAPVPAMGPPALCTLTIPPDAADGVADEAERVARYIRSQVDAGRRSCGDFLVLTRKKKNLQVYADALERLGVPVEVSGGSGFSESEDVRQLALLLLALTDSQDQVALVGVLRGAWFGLSDPQLFAWKERGGSFSIFAGPDDSTDDPVGLALSRLRDWHKWTRMLPAGAALERVLDDSGYLALAASRAGGVEAGDLLHAVDRVRAVVEAGFTLADAAQALASWSELDEDGPEESAEIESLPLEPGRPDVVRVMNLHKAKGLEAPVVFLADPAGGFAPRVDVRIERGSVRLSAEVRGSTTAPASPWSAGSSAPATGYFQICEPGKYGRPGRALAQPAGWDGLHAEEMAYLEAEQMRLLYVAATRAKDVLIVSRWARSRGTAAWSALEPHLGDCAELTVPDIVDDVAPQPVVLTAAAAAKADRAIEYAHGAAVKASWAATSVTAEAKRFPTMTAGGDDEVVTEDPTRVMTEETPSRRADAGMAWGALVHGLLEHAMRFPLSTRDDLRRLARWLIMEQPSLQVVIEQAIDTVEAVGASDRWKAARSSTEHHEEAPFSVRVQRPGELPTVISGTIDLVYRSGDAWCVVDYKTDVDGGAALAGKYAAQVAAYRNAWATVSGGKVDSHVVATRS